MGSVSLPVRRSLATLISLLAGKAPSDPFLNPLFYHTPHQGLWHNAFLCDVDHLCKRTGTDTIISALSLTPCWLMLADRRLGLFVITLKRPCRRPTGTASITQLRNLLLPLWRVNISSLDTLTRRCPGGDSHRMITSGDLLDLLTRPAMPYR